MTTVGSLTFANLGCCFFVVEPGLVCGVEALVVFFLVVNFVVFFVVVFFVVFELVKFDPDVEEFGIVVFLLALELEVDFFVVFFFVVDRVVAGFFGASPGANGSDKNDACLQEKE